MTFTADSAQNFLRKFYNYSTQKGDLQRGKIRKGDIRKGDVIVDAIAIFKSLNVDEQLAVLWSIYTEMGNSITPVATGPARLQLAAGLLNQIKLMSNDEQLQAMRNLLGNKNTQISRSYGVLNTNTKLAFWYELSELMVEGVIVSMPDGYEISQKGEEVFETLKQLDFVKQITFLRKIAADMGVDPFT